MLPAESPRSPKVACRFAGANYGETNCANPGRFSYLSWLPVGPCARKVLQLTCFRDYSLSGSNSPEVQRQEMRTWSSLPDAPSSIQPPTQAERSSPRSSNETGSPLTLGAVGVSAGVMRGTELGHVTPRPQPGLTALYQVAFTQKNPARFLVSTCIRRCSSRTHVITLRPATALWAGPPTQLRAFLSRVTTPERRG